MLLDMERGLDKLQEYGDSLNLIKWIKGEILCNHLPLSILLEEIQFLCANFFIFCPFSIYTRKGMWMLVFYQRQGYW